VSPRPRAEAHDGNGDVTARQLDWSVQRRCSRLCRHTSPLPQAGREGRGASHLGGRSCMNLRIELARGDFMLRPRMRFGIFMAPFHPVNENPTLCLERDRELVQWLDELGFDEAWIGEHHSAGYEIIASPELFIADVAARTKHIRLGTGVVSVPYHQPLMVADRMAQLDHLTRGRAMFGVGPGLLPSDAMMLCIDPRRPRDMMAEALQAIIPLLRGEVVTMKTDWFELHDAKLQLAPYSRPQIEMAVAASVSPSGPRTAGRWGIAMRSPAATSTGGFSALAYHWGICEETARAHDQRVDRCSWRIAGPVHIAETVEQAREDVRFGLAGWLYYFQKVVALPGVPEQGPPGDRPHPM